jgi:hypothetical protein
MFSGVELSELTYCIDNVYFAHFHLQKDLMVVVVSMVLYKQRLLESIHLTDTGLTDV